MSAGVTLLETSPAPPSGCQPCPFTQAGAESAARPCPCRGGEGLDASDAAWVCLLPLSLVLRGGACPRWTEGLPCGRTVRGMSHILPHTRAVRGGTPADVCLFKPFPCFGARQPLLLSQNQNGQCRCPLGKAEPRAELYQGHAAKVGGSSVLPAKRA